MTIQVFTRSQNPDLYKMMRRFIPEDVECIRCDQFSEHWWQAKDYLHHIIREGVEWVVSIDDDCLISDWAAVLDIIRFMDGRATYAGMPDGGVVPHRCHSWAVFNPYFLVINAKEIRQGAYQHYPQWVVDSCGFQPEWEENKPEIIKGNYHHNNTEIFNGLFYFLYSQYEPLFLNAYTHNDGWSTMLQWQGKTFAYHSWFAREFTTDAMHRDRILALFEEVKLLTNK
jgi:hypothetical protein